MIFGLYGVSVHAPAETLERFRSDCLQSLWLSSTTTVSLTTFLDHRTRTSMFTLGHSHFYCDILLQLEMFSEISFMHGFGQISAPNQTVGSKFVHLLMTNVKMEPETALYEQVKP